MQTSKASSGQFSIWDQGQGSLLSALAGFTVSSHVLVITFDFSFLLYYLIFSPLRTRGGNPMGGKNSLGWDMAFVWKAFHICLLECLNLEHLILANHLAESLLKMSCTSDVHIIYLFFKKMNSMKHLSFPHLWRFCCFVTRALLVSGFHSFCRDSLSWVHLLCNHCPTKVLIFLPSFPSPSISASRVFHESKEIYGLFLNSVLK